MMSSSGRSSGLAMVSNKLHAVLLVVLSEFVLSKFCFVLSEFIPSKFSEFCLEVLFQLKEPPTEPPAAYEQFACKFSNSVKLKVGEGELLFQEEGIKQFLCTTEPPATHLLVDLVCTLIIGGIIVGEGHTLHITVVGGHLLPTIVGGLSLYYSRLPKTYCAQCNRYRPYSYSRSPVRHRYLADSPYDSREYSPDDSYHVRRYRHGRRSPSPLGARRRSRRSYSHSVSPRPRRSYRRNYPRLSPEPKRRTVRESYSPSSSRRHRSLRSYRRSPG
ncbi:PREDICTED: PRUPE_6G062700 [Prunus dulcis]|uniref:PREDICTED: PRUPE_6G062700 n=1 Tax=Prunus dulcis TaxID=3755 RepID=A0A5E4FXH6_PRUDU|nr:PREDICTED: PRUPE_6G062700 [Prunus dulcis]